MRRACFPLRPIIHDHAGKLPPQHHASSCLHSVQAPVPHLAQEIGTLCSTGQPDRALSAFPCSHSVHAPMPCFAQEIRTLCSTGQLDRALSAFQFLMEQLGTGPGPPIFLFPFDAYLSLLQGCCQAKSRSKTQRVHDLFRQHFLTPSGYLGDQLVGALAKCDALNDAFRILCTLPLRSAHSWTALISGCNTECRARDAMELYHCMQEDGVEPNQHTFVSLLKCCRLGLPLQHGEMLLADAVRRGFTSNIFVLNSVLSMYIKSDSMLEAENVFNELSQRDIVSWSAMLSAYAEWGEGSKALQLYRQMHEEGLDPDQRIFVAAIQASSLMKVKIEDVSGTKDQLTQQMMSLEIGQALHADARRNNFSSDVFVGSTLISFYGKFGWLEKSESVFHALSHHDGITWSSMISAYVEQGQGDMALQFYRQFMQEGVSPIQQTIVIALQACVTLVQKDEDIVAEERQGLEICTEVVQALYADAQRGGLIAVEFCDGGTLTEPSVPLGDHFVAALVEAGAIDHAYRVLFSLPIRSVYAWTMAISGYTEQGRGHEALNLKQCMQEDGVEPDQYTFVALISACALTLNLQEGQKLHADAQVKGFVSDVFVGSSLITMYSKHGCMLEVENVFEGLIEYDVVAWSAMISAYVDAGKGNEALRLYRQSQAEGVVPDQQMLVFVLQGCCMLQGTQEEVQLIHTTSLEIGRALHADAWRKGFNLDTFVNNTLVSMYSTCQSIVEAENVFNAPFEHDVVSWNAMLSAYMEHDGCEKALWLYWQMIREGFSPNGQTFAIIIQACGDLAAQEDTTDEGRQLAVTPLDIGHAFHGDACKKNLMSEAFVTNSIINMYIKFGCLVEAERVFDSLSKHDLVSWNTMLSALVDLGQEQKALQLHRQMKEQDIAFNDITIVNALEACSLTGSVEKCKGLHFDTVIAGYDTNRLVEKALLRAYSACGLITDSQSMFDGFSERDSAFWTACIAGHAQRGNIVASLQIFEGMQEAGITPNESTFVELLSACSHTGLVNVGVKLFDSMLKDYGIMPSANHYLAITNLVGRAGGLKELEGMLLQIPVQAIWITWLYVLGMCRTYGNLQLGKEAFDKVVALKPKEAIAYVLMSNIYADAGLHKYAIELRKRRLDI